MELEEAYNTLELPDPCRDHDIRCPQWVKQSECENNPGFMFDHCMLSCHVSWAGCAVGWHGLCVGAKVEWRMHWYCGVWALSACLLPYW